MTLWRIGIATVVLGTIVVDKPDPGTDSKRSLMPLQAFVGQWRGVGQPRRGSNRGAWREQSDWKWKFQQGEAYLQFENTGAKYFKDGLLAATENSGEYKLLATAKKSDKKVVYRGKRNEDGRLVLFAQNVPVDLPARISVRQVAGGDRLLILYERQSSSNRYSRMAELGFTRVGSGFGRGTNYVECVVTGGLGTIEVSFEGKTYFVCCSGCLDYFNDSPEEVLAEYKSRKEEEKQKRAR